MKILIHLFVISFILLTGCSPVEHEEQEDQATQLFASLIEDVSGTYPEDFEILEYSNTIPEESSLLKHIPEGVNFQQFSLEVKLNSEIQRVSLVSTLKPSLDKNGAEVHTIIGEFESNIDNPVMFKVEAEVEGDQMLILSENIIDPDTGEDVEAKIITDVNGYEVCDYSDVRGTGWINCARRCMSCLLSTDGYTGQSLAILGILGGGGCGPCAYTAVILLGIGSLGCAGGC